MLQKHRPEVIDLAQSNQWASRINGVLAEIPKINELEHALEVQDEDAELTQINKSLKALVTKTQTSMIDGNTQIKKKIGTQPDSDKVMTEEQYEQQMSFILKH